MTDDICVNHVKPIVVVNYAVCIISCISSCADAIFSHELIMFHYFGNVITVVIFFKHQSVYFFFFVKMKTIVKIK